jgi:RNA polymerase sigma factor (sigma-70 family)
VYQTRQTLLHRVKHRHDERSWDEFVGLYRPYLYVICQRMNVSHHDAEDIVQQVLIKLWDRLPDFNYDDRRRFRGWVGSITRNCANDFFRKQKRLAKTIEKSTETKASYQMMTDSEVARIADMEWKKYSVALAIERIRDQFPAKAIKVFQELHRGTPRKTVAQKYNLTPDSVSAYKGRVLTALCAEIRALEEEL